MKKITRIGTDIPAIKARKKVAAYARVSKDSERLLHSVSTQISYYSSLIQHNPEWVYAGVYADEGITGTRTDLRSEFNKMLRDCEDGKIDIILTKSVSRFARNTVDLLKTVRHLKELGVEVRFEKENINSMSGDGELMLTILASFAQAESESTSQNIKWSKKKQAEQGIMTNTSAPFGYCCVDRKLVPVSEQAAVVRQIFKAYTEEGRTAYEIAKLLNAAGIPGQRGNHWQQCTVFRMLSNEAYEGDLKLLKYYVVDPLEHKSVKNKGERQMYLVEDDHEPIITREVYRKAQERLKHDAELGRYANRNVTWNEFTEKIVCKSCGRYFGKGHTALSSGRVVSWSCRKPGGKCMTPSILEGELKEIFCKITDTDEYSREMFEGIVDHIEVGLDDVITFFFKDGSKEGCQFKRRRSSPLMTRRHDTLPLRDKIRCPLCGGTYGYRSQNSSGKNSDYRIGYWRCKKCGGFSMRDDDLKGLIAKVMGTDGFDPVAFTKQVDYLTAGPDRKIKFIFRDGRKHTEKWNPPSHKGVRWTDERRKEAKESEKYLWTDERRRKASETWKRIRREQKEAKLEEDNKD